MGVCIKTEIVKGHIENHFAFDEDSETGLLGDKKSENRRQNQDREGS